MLLASRSAKLKGLSLAALGATGLAVAGISLVNTDLLVERSFNQALSAPVMTEGEYNGRNSGPAVAGTEEFWLGDKLPTGAARVSWIRGINVGDRIVIGASGRDMEIVELHELSADALRLASVSMPGHPVLVTARETGAEGSLMRFIVDAETFGAASKVSAKGPAAL